MHAFTFTNLFPSQKFEKVTAQCQALWQEWRYQVSHWEHLREAERRRMAWQQTRVLGSEPECLEIKWVHIHSNEFLAHSNQWYAQALVITVPRETLSACARICAHWHCMSQLSTPNVNTQAFSFQGSHLFANLTCISLIQSLQLLVPSYGTESPKSRPNSKLVFNPGHVLVIPASFFPTPSLVSTLFCHPILPFLVLAFTPLSLYPPLFFSLPFFSHCFLSSSSSPLLSPSSLFSLYFPSLYSTWQLSFNCGLTHFTSHWSL